MPKKGTIMNSVYDLMQQMPLFQGLSFEHLMDIVEKVRFDFRKAASDEVIVYQGDPCTELVYIIRGRYTSLCEAPELKLKVKEVLEGPALLEPYSLFGYDAVFTATYRAVEELQYVIIPKSYISSYLGNFEIFRLNYFNILSRRAQQLRNKARMPVGETVGKKFVHFMIRQCEKQTGAKVVSIRMLDLAVLLDETRLNISRLLNTWEAQGLLLLTRQTIEISEFERLIELVKDEK